MKITDDQVAAACEIAGQVFDGKLNVAQGVRALTGVHGLNQATANDFINDYKCLVKGKVFHRAMSAPAMRYFMDRIFAHRDDVARANAITALRAHVAYYEGHYKVTMHSMRAVADEFDKLRETTKSIDQVDAAFVAAVQASALAPRADRLRRLALASKTPESVIVPARVFVRNPDVVAEALFRADGKCENCNADAPFRRATDGSPYLEVHHRIRLADGGDDSVENAVALCPNCHRHAHYGKAQA